MAETKNLNASAKIVADLESRCNEAIKANNLKLYNELRVKLDDELKEYNSLAMKAVFALAMKAKHPCAELARLYTFAGKKAKEEKDVKTKELLALKVNDADIQLRLGKFVKDNGLDTAITKGIQDLQTMYNTREKDVLAMTPVEFRKAYKDGSSFERELMEALQNGETPLSNTKICAKLQEIVNACGINKRVTNHDTQVWLQQHAFTTGKDKGSIKPVTGGKFESLVFTVLSMKVTGMPYTYYENQKTN